MPQPPTSPIRYRPAFETPEEAEAETTEQLLETLRQINATTFKDSGHGLRGVHAKSHGLLSAELHVLDGLPDVLAHGLFAKAGSYPTVMRFSTVPGDLLADSVSTPRGLAIKLIGVEGERVAGSEGDMTQDFVMVNGPAFGSPDPRHFLKSLKLTAATTDKGESLKKAFSAVARGTEKALEKLGVHSDTLVGLGGHPETNVLGETYYTQVPLLYGPYIAKLSLVPVSPELRALTNAPVDLHDKPNGLREAVNTHFASHGGTWELRVQLCTDITAMPIEDASIAWPEALSPYVTVARVMAAPQIAWSEARSAAIDDGMSFSPWHALAAHRPLGSVMRVRKLIYQTMAQVRAQQNKTSIAEPRAMPML